MVIIDVTISVLVNEDDIRPRFVVLSSEFFRSIFCSCCTYTSGNRSPYGLEASLTFAIGAMDLLCKLPCKLHELMTKMNLPPVLQRGFSIWACLQYVRTFTYQRCSSFRLAYTLHFLYCAYPCYQTLFTGNTLSVSIDHYLVDFLEYE